MERIISLYLLAPCFHTSLLVLYALSTNSFSRFHTCSIAISVSVGPIFVNQHISGTSEIFCRLHVTHGCDFVLLWRRCDTLCTSGLWMTSHLHMARVTATRKVYSQSDSTGNSVDLTPYTQTDPPGVSTGTGTESDIYDRVVLLCPRRMRGALSDTANRPSVCPRALGAHLPEAIGTLAACSLTMCGLRTRQRTDVGPPRVKLPSAGGIYRVAAPAAITCFTCAITV